MSDDKPTVQKKEVGTNNRRHFKYRSNKCLNCSQPLDLSDVYCPYCSQLNSTKQLSLKDFFSEFVNSIVSYDSRLRYTVYDLLFRPGTITRRDAEGKRLRYANPFRFFLSVSIIYFLLNGFITTLSPEANPFININNNTTEQEAQDAAAIVAENMKNLPPQAQGAMADSIQQVVMTITDSIAKQTDTLKSAAKEEKKKEFVNISESDLDTLEWTNRLVERFVLYHDFYDITEIKDSKIALDSMGHNNTRLNRWVYEKNSTIDRIKDDPYGFFNYLAAKIPFFLFFFTPFFALFFWLIYSKKKYSYVEHMIFIFHIFSFLFLAMLIALVPDLILGTDVFIGLLFLLVGPFYFYKALRNFYKQGRFITIIKFLFLNFVFFISANIAALLFFTVTAAVY